MTTRRERIAQKVAQSVIAAEDEPHHPDFHPGHPNWSKYSKGYVYHGGGGGGAPDLPSAVPEDVAGQFHDTFEQKYIETAAKTEGADPDDPNWDTLNYSETAVDDAGGYAVLTQDLEHAANHGSHELEAPIGIGYEGHEVDPISFQGPDGETWHISGGIGGV